MPPFPQVDDLLANFERYLQAFDRLKPFHGGQVDNHLKTIGFVRAAAKPIDVLENPRWYQYLVATLKAWNMRKRGATLVDSAVIQASLESLRTQIIEIQDIRLETITAYNSVLVEGKLWRILGNLEVGNQAVNLVVNTKTLHHLLPDLVPPMDRAYTITFFFGTRNLLAANEKRLFERMWPEFCRIARDKHAVMQPYLNHGMHTSIPKMIDNAIVAYVKTDGHP